MVRCAWSPSRAGADAPTIQRFVQEALVHYRADPGITRVEWKTRGHDHAQGLHGALSAHGFVPGDPESTMIGATQALALDVPLPEGLALRRITAQDDVRAMSALQDEVFGDPVSKEMAEALLRRLSRDDRMELWVAEVAGRMVSAPPRAGARDRLHRYLGWGDAHGVARSRHLPGVDGRPGPVGTPGRRNTHLQRLDRVLPSDT